jgi:hypothetical protein
MLVHEMAEPDLHVDRDGRWRVYRDAGCGLCLAVTVPAVAWYEIAITLNAEETAAFEAGDLASLARQAERLRTWPDQFSDRLAKDERPK